MDTLHLTSSYASLEEAVKDLFGDSVFIVKQTRLHGGDINEACQAVLSNGEQIFIKKNSLRNLPFFLTESTGLKALRFSNSIGVPEILGIGTDKQRGESFLLLEYVESISPAASYWETFGHQLARLHQAECGFFVKGKGAREKYGFTEDNYIGATPQRNRPQKNWIDFYRECRLLPQLAMAKDSLEPSLLKKAYWIAEHLDSFLREPEFPSLLHGDLWSGNILCGPDGKAWLIDPASYVGDLETDLAMTQLFGSFPQAFYLAYSEIIPIDWKGFEERKNLYHLYHLLNHLNLFGDAYLESVSWIIRRYGR